METLRRWGGIVVAIAAFALAAASVAGCATPTSTTTTPPQTGSTRTITGNANFKWNGPLPSDAQLGVKVVDNSNPDTATATLGETTVTAGGKSTTIAFSVPYDVSNVDPSHVYVMRAEIVSAGKTLLVQKGNTLVITQGAPTAGIAVPMKQP